MDEKTKELLSNGFLFAGNIEGREQLDRMLKVNKKERIKLVYIGKAYRVFIKGSLSSGLQ